MVRLGEPERDRFAWRGFRFGRPNGVRRTIARFITPPKQAIAPPNYVIDNAAEVNALLPQLQESQVRSTITKLSTEYKNRYYTTSGGVTASGLSPG